MGTDFEKIGLKAGLEVHQQLDTGKLFCRCPSILREDKPDIVFTRKLRAVASELGEFDAAALEAFKKGHSFEYQGYSDTTCLVEADESPPRPCDSEALETVLKIALMAKSHILDTMVVMRKAVVDGSNTSAFQRTMLAAVGGTIELSNKKVGIQSIALEEDAARPIERREETVVYRLDRLGIPLIELATSPDLKTPEEVKECALKIGALFRRTCRAKRGLGTIRQDLNVSIAGGARVEIKGVQALDLIDEFVRREAQRQQGLLEIKKELEERGIKEAALTPVDVSDVFRETECKFLNNKKVFGAKATGWGGLIGKEIQPGRRFGTELASYVKARAGLNGIIHSDELPAYGISEEEFERLNQWFGASGINAFILVQASEEKAKQAFKALEARMNAALEHVPEETRNALEDGNTEYSRPLPGAARMYPETDLGTINTSEELLTNLRKKLPLTVEQREKLYKSKGLSGKLVQKMVLSNSACFFEKLIAKDINATTAATLLLETSVQLKRQHSVVVNKKMLESLLVTEKNGKITKDVFVELLLKWAKNPGKSLEEIVGTGMERTGQKELETIVNEIVEQNPDLIKKQGMHAIGALMGETMKKMRGKASGQEISEILKKAIGSKIEKK